jgi:hypothetical protein
LNRQALFITIASFWQRIAGKGSCSTSQRGMTCNLVRAAPLTTAIIGDDFLEVEATVEGTSAKPSLQSLRGA